MNGINGVKENEKNSLHRLYPISLLFCLLLAYMPIFEKLIGRWEGGDNSYCYLTIPFFAYLCWELRESFRFSFFSFNPFSLVFFASSSVLIAMGELGSLETLSYVGLWLAMVGIFVALYGARTKRLAFPLSVLFFMIPLPPFINRILTFRLRLWASALAAELLRFFNVSVVQEGNVLDLGVAKLQVADACSGLRYLMPMFFLALIVGFYLLGKRRILRGILLLLVMPFSIFVNGVRVFGMGLFESRGSSLLTEGFWHDFTGWLVFMVSGVALAGAALILRAIFPSSNIASVDSDGLLPSGLKPFFANAAAAASCAIILGGGWTATSLPGMQQSVNRASFKSFPSQIGPWRGQRHIIEKEILASLWADDYVSATFEKPESLARVLLLIPYYDYQATQHTAHAPQSCLLGGGWTILKTTDRQVSVEGDKSITLRSMEMKKGADLMVASYFFYQRGRVIVSPWMNKLYLMWDAVAKRRTDGALVRIEVVVPPGESVSSANEVIDEYLKLLWPILSDYIPG